MVQALAQDHNNSRVEFSLDEPPINDKDAPWSDYLRGVISELRKREYTLCGADLVISGNVPQGAGLSSSASLEIALVAALTSLSQESISGEVASQVGQAAENNFVGCNCGIMDQLASALGQAGHAMLLDCRSLKTRMVALPENTSLVIINSNVKRGLVGSEYNTRRIQCELAAKHFNVPALRDISLEQLKAEKNKLDKLVYKRALHVVTENNRTLLAAEALAEKNMLLLGELMDESHTSMRDDFEITVPAVDELVRIMKSVIGVQGGARMTGGGFGGCCVALVPTELEGELSREVEKSYPQVSGLKPEIFVCQASNGGFARM